MSEEIFRQGGPHNIRRTGQDRYTMSVPMPTDEMGMTSRECADSSCSPGSFKVKFGTGVTGEQEEAYCPYCRRAGDPGEFMTKDQHRYCNEIVAAEVREGVSRMMRKALRLGPTGKKKIGGGLLSMEISMKTDRRPPPRRPWEEQLRRDVTCPHCTLEHAVYGLAVWCPDCAKDIFVTHIKTEAQVIRAMLNDVERRSSELGPRVAARDIENGLEDVVSILEAAMKALARRKLVTNGALLEHIGQTFRKQVRNRFQSFDGCVEVFSQLFDLDLAQALEADAVSRFKHTLEKRHPITHNLGIVDRKYLETVRTGEAEGRDVNLDEDEVITALDTTVSLINHAHAELFPS